jgi:DNA/RNA endonuclease YhcR with UshA esterase domain
VEVNEGGEEGEVTEDNNTNLEENESVLVHSDEGTVTVTYVAQTCHFSYHTLYQPLFIYHLLSISALMLIS